MRRSVFMLFWLSLRCCLLRRFVHPAHELCYNFGRIFDPVLIISLERLDIYLVEGVVNHNAACDQSKEYVGPVRVSRGCGLHSFCWLHGNGFKSGFVGYITHQTAPEWDINATAFTQ